MTSRHGRAIFSRGLLLCLLFPATAVAQDSHYWSQQYGTRSTLLGGAVVGSVSDLSATYYNPGALSILSNPDFVLGAQLYEISSMSVAASFEENLSSTNVDAVPHLAAGLIGLKLFGSDRLAYSILLRQRFNFSINYRLVGSDGDKDISNEYTLDQRLSETWLGLTWSKSLQDSMGVGVSLYGVGRSQRTVEWVGVTQAEPVVTGGRYNEFGYTHFRILLKAGAQWMLHGWDLGTAVTLPSIPVTGWGDTYYNRTVTVPPHQAFEASHHENQFAKYKSPLSIAGGAARSPKRDKRFDSGDVADSIRTPQYERLERRLAKWRRITRHSRMTQVQFC